MKTDLLHALISPMTRWGLRTKVTLSIILPLLIILGCFTVIEYLHRRDTFLDNLSLLAAYSGQVVEASLRQAMLDDNFDEVQVLLDTIESSGQFDSIYLLDTEGEIIFAPQNRNLGEHLDNTAPDCLQCHHLPTEARQESVVVKNTDGNRIFRSMRPIENRPACNECHSEDERLLGLLLTDIPVDPMESALVTDLQENLVWWIGTILVTVIVVNLVLNRLVLSRLGRLTKAIVSLAEGRTHQTIDEDHLDEIGQLNTTFNLMAQKIESREEENRELSHNLQNLSARRGELLKRLITAQEHERKRVARELHDELGQSLSGLALHAQMLEGLLCKDINKAQKQIRDIHGLIEETTNHMYDLIMDLRPSVLDDMGLAPALRLYAERVLVKAGIRYEIDTHGMTQRLPSVIETTCYRIFQEALNNIVRHAHADQVTIALAIHENVFEALIIDDGQGFDISDIPMDGSSPRGIGLLGMMERATQCHGNFQIDSRIGHGTTIRVSIPLTKDNEHA